jgi:hypothetical protein
MKARRSQLVARRKKVPGIETDQVTPSALSNSPVYGNNVQLQQSICNLDLQY